MMEKFFSFMSFYEQHQQAAPAQSNNIDNNNNNRATPMSLDGSSYARGNQQQPTFAPYEPQRGSISFTPQPQSSPGQEKTLDALQPRIFEPETSATLRWRGKVDDASVFQVWGALSLVRDAKTRKLSFCTLNSVFLSFLADAPPWQFYHPRSRRVFSSQDVTFDEFICFYRLHPHASHPVPLAPLFLVPVPPPGKGSRGATTGGDATGGAGSGGASTGGAGSWGAATGGADAGGPASSSGGGAVGDPAGGPGAGQPLQPDLLETLSPQAICAWIVRQGSPGGGGYGPANARAASPRGTAGGAACARGTRGAAGAGAAGATSPRGAIGAGGARGQTV
ncbi:unnamed protein product [Closterium sp. NIES-54]